MIVFTLTTALENNNQNNVINSNFLIVIRPCGRGALLVIGLEWFSTSREKEIYITLKDEKVL